MDDERENYVNQENPNWDQPKQLRVNYVITFDREDLYSTNKRKGQLLT